MLFIISQIFLWVFATGIFVGLLLIPVFVMTFAFDIFMSATVNNVCNMFDRIPLIGRFISGVIGSAFGAVGIVFGIIIFVNYIFIFLRCIGGMNI